MLKLYQLPLCTDSSTHQVSSYYKLSSSSVDLSDGLLCVNV